MTVTVLPRRPAREILRRAVIFDGIASSEGLEQWQFFSGQPQRGQTFLSSVEKTVPFFIAIHWENPREGDQIPHPTRRQ